MQKKFDIAIVGAGLAGSIIALGLAKKTNLKIVLIDPKDLHVNATDKRDPRTSAIAHEAQVILSEFDIWDDLKLFAGPIEQIRITDNDSKLHLHFDNKDVEYKTLGYMIENNFLLHVLHKKIIENKIEFKKALVKNVQTNDFNAEIELDNSTKITADLLIVADGKFSKIRDWLDIDYTIKDYHQASNVCLVEHEKPHESIAQEKFYPSGPFAILPMQCQNISGIVWTEEKETAFALSKLDDNKFMSFLSEKFGDYLGPLKLISERHVFPLSLVYANRLFTKRAVLIGDAAHSIHPIAGQGLNLSIRDINVLVEHIKENNNTGLDIGSSRMLEEYSSKRKFDDFNMIMITDILDKFFRIKSPPISLIRKFGLALINEVTFLKQFFMEYAMGKRD
ncbi:MAG: UbiH/UbiF/VisC/COQ6 family ubiquinone biosynthesis hydroxylase [Sphingobacteriia bacterium]|nr:UbiH/UbiF/VisC/COQ6 family ubiquinone biosynthesis hydroxylase [Sphingobacteriia bacterium]